MGDTRPLSDPMLAITVPCNAGYARRHGYAFRFVRYHTKLRVNGGGHAHPSWCKVAAVLDALPDYDAVMWIDSDAAFVRQDVPLEELLRGLHRRSEHALIEFAVNTPFNRGPCAGVFVAHRSPRTIALLRAWLDARHGCSNATEHPWEQAIVQEWRRGSRRYPLGTPGCDLGLLHMPTFVHAPNEGRDNVVVHVSSNAGAQRLSLLRAACSACTRVDGDVPVTPMDPNEVERRAA